MKFYILLQLFNKCKKINYILLLSLNELYFISILVTAVSYFIIYIFLLNLYL